MLIVSLKVNEVKNCFMNSKLCEYDPMCCDISLIPLLLCGDESLKFQVSEKLTARACVSQLEFQFSSSWMDVGFVNPVADSDHGYVFKSHCLHPMNMFCMTCPPMLVRVLVY